MVRESCVTFSATTSVGTEMRQISWPVLFSFRSDQLVPSSTADRSGSTASARDTSSLAKATGLSLITGLGWFSQSRVCH
jgi:hypothetical protein